MPVKVKLVEVDGSVEQWACVKTEEGGGQKEGSGELWYWWRDEGKMIGSRMGLVWKEWSRHGRAEWRK